MPAKTMTVAGIMSGTSADGIDVALVRIVPRKQRAKLTLLAHESFAFPAALRRAVLQAMNAKSTSTAELARLHWRLGLAYAEAIKATLERHPVNWTWSAVTVRLSIISRAPNSMRAGASPAPGNSAKQQRLQQRLEFQWFRTSAPRTC